MDIFYLFKISYTQALIVNETIVTDGGNDSDMSLKGENANETDHFIDDSLQLRIHEVAVPATRGEVRQLNFIIDSGASSHMIPLEGLLYSLV